MKKYLGYGLAGIVGVVALTGLTSSPTPQTAPADITQAVTPVVEQLTTPTRTVQSPQVIEQASVQNTVQPTPTTYTPVTEQKSAPLSNDNYYTNSAGNEIHSPAYAPSQPAGASARCRDGTYSFSASRRGTCSHHGGVAEWL
ncbi:MAG: DUF3761 domain-containing protein [Patescibacteria group bacterium]